MKKETTYPVLQISDDLRIRRLDVRNIVLEQRHIAVARPAVGKRKASQAGQERWEVLGYYASLRDALESMPGQVIEPAPLVELRQGFLDLDERIGLLIAKTNQEGPAF